LRKALEMQPEQPHVLNYLGYPDDQASTSTKA
jgi:hypothetical protein